MSSHTPCLDAGCNRAEKDIESTLRFMSAVLAKSVYEKHGVADNRLLMRPFEHAGKSDGEFCHFWDMCQVHFKKINDVLFQAVKDASIAAENRGEDGAEYMTHWWAAWVSSPVSTRLLRAMQTLLDGCIFQVREDFLHTGHGYRYLLVFRYRHLPLIAFVLGCVPGLKWYRQSLHFAIN